MKEIRKTSQREVFEHWENVERLRFARRGDVVLPLVAYQDLTWSLSQIEEADIAKIFIISSEDWQEDGFCVPDFRLTTAIKSYNTSAKREKKYADINAKEGIFNSTPKLLDTRLFLVSDDQSGPYTIIEGNRRAVALGSLNRLAGLEVYLGVSPAIRNYVWSQAAYL
jgi:hypothetical protein